MITKVYSAIPYGYEGKIIDVEADSTKSLPSFSIVGMANKTIYESRERVRAAIVNSNFTFPVRKVTVNLAPAELTKDGTHLDLPIALAILSLSQQLPQESLENRLFTGELSLDGLTRPVRGIINIVESAKKAGFTEVFIPLENLSQASLISGISIIGVRSLREVVLHLLGIAPIKNVVKNNKTDIRLSIISSYRIQTSIKASQNVVENTEIDEENFKADEDGPCSDEIFDNIIGQSIAKRALTIAIAGHHNVMLFGPPGTGKTLLARAAANLLPPPSPEEQIAITKLASLRQTSTHIATTRPFRSPHHTASTAAIIGGGPHTTPGEISLAHNGVLFLDEFPEYSRSVIEALRQPLENNEITISRAKTNVTYPADFILIATMNPCPCGRYGDRYHPCTCTPTQIQNYRKKISGPILDRIDIVVKVDRPKLSVESPEDRLNHKQPSIYVSEHKMAQKAIQNALRAQKSRYTTPRYNSSLTPSEISQKIILDPTAKTLLKRAQRTLQLSLRAYFKIIKVARTIADLENSPTISAQHLSEAVSLRQQIS